MASVLIRRALPSVFGILLLASSAAAQGVPRLDSYSGVAVRILQSNNAGDIHHIIDPTVNKVVGLIRGCPHAHILFAVINGREPLATLLENLFGTGAEVK